MRRLAVVGLCSAAAVLAGCPSFSTMGTARTLDQGKFQILVAPQLEGIGTTTNGRPGTVFVPQIEVGGRYGITDRVEIGAKAWFLGFELDSKIGILRSQNTVGLNLSLDPGVGYIGVGGGTTSSGDPAGILNVVTFYLPVLVGFQFAGHEVVLGPKAIDQLWFISGTGSSGGAVNLLFVGSSVGFALKLGSKFRLLPEFSIVYPVLTSGPAGTTTTLMPTGVVYQIGLGLLFGG